METEAVIAIKETRGPKGEAIMLNVNAKNLGNVTVLSLQGQVVNGETETLRNAIDSLPITRAVILDLARVTTVDAHGLGVLLELREKTNSKGIRFQLMNVSQPLRQVLEITRLNTVFQIISGVEFFPTVAHEQRIQMLRSCA
jgi:anti-anti-sigma factor